MRKIIDQGYAATSDVLEILLGYHSEWQWAMTEEGDLALMCFPQEETYERVRESAFLSLEKGTA